MGNLILFVRDGLKSARVVIVILRSRKGDEGSAFERFYAQVAALGALKNRSFTRVQDDTGLRSE